MKYCRNCRQNVNPPGARDGVILALFIMGIVCVVLFGIIFGGFFMMALWGAMLLYIVVAEADKRCPICNSKNWGEAKS